MAKDPVCGMEVNPESAPASAEHEGTTYYFCSLNCRDSFVAAPHKFVGGEPGKESGKGFLAKLFRRG